jgi:hypothetical protein
MLHLARERRACIDTDRRQECGNPRARRRASQRQRPRKPVSPSRRCSLQHWPPVVCSGDQSVNGELRPTRCRDTEHGVAAALIVTDGGGRAGPDHCRRWVATRRYGDRQRRYACQQAAEHADGVSCAYLPLRVTTTASSIRRALRCCHLRGQRVHGARLRNHHRCVCANGDAYRQLGSAGRAAAALGGTDKSVLQTRCMTAALPRAMHRT